MKYFLFSFIKYFSNFLWMIFSFSLLFLYIMLTVPIVFWIGNMSGEYFKDNIGGLFLEFLKNDFLIFFLFPLLPIIGGYLILSIFVWLFYRDEEELRKIGFQNVILSILTVFSLIFLPMMSTHLKYQIQERRDLALARFKNNDDVVYINQGFDKEFLKLYQTLADEGIQAWRKDPVAVVKNELEKGDLTFLSREENALERILIDAPDSGVNPAVIVMLKNERFEVEIRLNRYWESSDGIWLVKSYKILRDYQSPSNEVLHVDD